MASTQVVSMQEAKYYLDTLLAADTPEIRSQ
jgi:hypothetical protein